MPDVRLLIENRLKPAFDALLEGSDPVVRPSERADFQVNGVLGLAKRLGRTPSEVAGEILRSVDLTDLCDEVEVSGPGFVNLTVSAELLSDLVEVVAGDERLGVPKTSRPLTVVIDYSSPNVAKEMHVGHLRSTVIGDAICRLLVWTGHNVIRENHVGDWGTPFGMLIEHLLDLGEQEAVHELCVGDLNTFYREARASFDSDPEFAERSRRRVVLLQGSDPDTLRLWRVLVEQSLAYFSEIYRRLGVLLTDEDVVGESFYNPMLGDVVDDLDSAGLLSEDGGAQCVFPAGFANREGEPLPLIVRKSDDGYGYAATDLAAIRDRVNRLGADRILYVVGLPQSQHLQMCFAVAAAAGWLSQEVEALHVGFGSVLGPDRKVFRTRSGGTAKLVDLIDEAEARAAMSVSDRATDMDPAEREKIVPALAMAAIKYADLSNDRTKDYVFDLERMVAFEGDTGPYMQYAHARCRSIFRRGGAEAPVPHRPRLSDPAERALALALLGFEEAVVASADHSSPHRLCAYLSSLAGTFTTFYDRCPVLKAPDPVTRKGRLLLCDVTARTLEQGLALLGIIAPDRM